MTGVFLLTKAVLTKNILKNCLRMLLIRQKRMGNSFIAGNTAL